MLEFGGTELAAQVVHSTLLTLLLYFPTAHAVHALAPTPTASVPTPQLAHDAFPAALLNFPVMHNAH